MKRKKKLESLKIRLFDFLFGRAQTAVKRYIYRSAKRKTEEIYEKKKIAQSIEQTVHSVVGIIYWNESASHIHSLLCTMLPMWFE